MKPVRNAECGMRSADRGTLALLAEAFPAIALAEAGQALPGEIQYLPPGVQNCVPKILGSTENTTQTAVQVVVNAGTAARLQELLAGALGRWKRGLAPRPWLDENHKGEAAVGWPLEIFWGGDDPRTGGVRMRVQWTGYGEQLLRAHAYSSFSPSILIEQRADGRPAEVLGTFENLGGLVNQPGFRSQQGLQQIAARAGDMGCLCAAADTTEKTKTMDAEMMQMMTEIRSSLGALTERLTKVEAAAATFAPASALQARDGQIQALQTKIDGQAAENNRRAAQALVASAVQAGKLAPQDAPTLKLWEDTLAADPARAELLAKLSANAALQSITAGARPNALGGENPGAKIKAAVNEIRNRDKCDWDAAFTTARAEKPELFKN